MLNTLMMTAALGAFAAAGPQDTVQESDAEVRMETQMGEPIQLEDSATSSDIELNVAAMDRIERDEVEEIAEKTFEAADADNSGTVDKTEYLNQAEQEVAALDGQMVTGSTTDPSQIDAETREGGDMTPDGEGKSPAAYLTAKFSTIALDGEEITEEDLRTSYTADFVEADEDGNLVLEDEEVQTFANLRLGRSAY